MHATPGRLGRLHAPNANRRRGEMTCAVLFALHGAWLQSRRACYSRRRDNIEGAVWAGSVGQGDHRQDRGTGGGCS
jgi:hypothetical protein